MSLMEIASKRKIQFTFMHFFFFVGACAWPNQQRNSSINSIIVEMNRDINASIYSLTTEPNPNYKQISKLNDCLILLHLEFATRFAHTSTFWILRNNPRISCALEEKIKVFRIWIKKNYFTFNSYFVQYYTEF